MMDLRSGLPFHLIRNGLPHTYPALDHDLRCDVAIIGGGITGALCAESLMRSGLAVCVLEAASIGTASTSASTALLQYEIDTPLHKLVDLVGQTSAVRSYLLCAQAVEELLELSRRMKVTDARQRKSFQYASSRADVAGLEKEEALRNAHGITVELLDAAEIKKRFGFRKPAGLLSAVAAELDPYRLTHALFQEVLQQGGKVFDRTPMKDFERSGEEFRIRTEHGPKVFANHLVMATGYASQQYLPKSVMDLNSTYAVVGQRTEADELWYQDCLIWETAMPYLYMRTTPDRRVMMGGLDEPFRNPKRRDALRDRKTRQLGRAFHKLFPKIPFEAEYSWCGTFGSTKDGLPYIDRDPRSGAWFVLGMGGNGITFSHVGAGIVRDAITGRPNPDRDLFRFDR